MSFFFFLHFGDNPSAVLAGTGVNGGGGVNQGLGIVVILIIPLVHHDAVGVAVLLHAAGSAIGEVVCHIRDGAITAVNLPINDGNIEINQEEAAALGVGIISSEKLTIAGGNITVYGNDDAMNAKTFAMTGGTVNASAADLFLAGINPETGEFVFGSDGVCRLVNKAEFSGGSLTLTALERMYPDVPTFFSKDLTVDGMKVSGGDTPDALAEKDTSTYTYIDTCIRIEKEGD